MDACWAQWAQALRPVQDHFAQVNIAITVPDPAVPESRAEALQTLMRAASRVQKAEMPALRAMALRGAAIAAMRAYGQIANGRNPAATLTELTHYLTIANACDR